MECELCLQREHCDCVGISKEEQSVLSNSPSIMFFCSACQPKASMALKFFNEINEKQEVIEQKLQEPVGSKAFQHVSS